MAIKAVLFDIDGTLVDSNDYHVRAWDVAFSEVDTHFDDQAIHDQIGKGTDNLVPTLLPGSSEEQQQAIGDRHGAVFKSRYLDEVKPFPGARDLLLRVHAAGHQVVLASSASQEELDHYLDLLDVRDIVSKTTTADDVKNTKPAPDIFATALEKIAPVQADEAIVVGDTPYDCDAARKCGIRAVAVRSGKFPDDALREAGAATIYDDVAQLLADYEGSLLAG